MGLGAYHLMILRQNVLRTIAASGTFARPRCGPLLAWGSAGANFGHVFKIQEEIWTGPHLQYRISALGQVASGSIDVAEDYVRLEVFLPWLLAKLAETLQPLIRKEGTLLLEKK